MLPELPDQIPPGQEIGSVTADGAFDTRKCHNAIAARGAVARSGILLNQWRSCPPRAPQARQVPETRYRSCNRAQRDPAHIKARRPDHLATMEWLSAPKQCRDMRRIRKRSGGSFSRRLDALHQAAGAATVCQRLRPSGCRTPDPCRRPERRHGTRNARHRGRGLSQSGEGRPPDLRRFMQQSHHKVPIREIALATVSIDAAEICHGASVLRIAFAITISLRAMATMTSFWGFAF